MAQSYGGAKSADHIYNYCVCFIDLLGQRSALQGQGLVTQFKSAEEEDEFKRTLGRSIGAIYRLQERASTILGAAHNTQRDKESPLRASLPPEQQAQWDAMFVSDVKTQRWSDGLVFFSSLGNDAVKCHVNEVFDMLTLSGALVMFGLTSGQPLRGGLEIAWATELHPGELYGAAVARAYELESEVAGYPRIVVGPIAYAYLKNHARSVSQDVFSRNDRSLAELCLSMIGIDSDGMAVVNYLGPEYQSAIGEAWGDEMYKRAREFIGVQLNEHRRNGNSKLAFRYAHLALYFDSFPPAPTPRSAPARAAP